MNAPQTNAANRSLNGSRQNFVPSTSQTQRRQRDFGLGYGNSSGYAAAPRYVADAGPRLFRLA